MAHELEIRNGRIEAAFSVKGAWHGLGTVLDNVANSDEMYRAAGLDWRVETMGLQRADGAAVPGMVATYRSDTRETLGIVSDRYTVVQNWQAFDFLDSLVQDNVMKYESAGALRGGKIIWVLGRLPSVDYVSANDALVRYLLFTAGHDGSTPITICPTQTRVVCANTRRVAIHGHNGIRHTGNVQEKLDMAHKLISQCDKQFTLYREQSEQLASVRWADTSEGRAAVKAYIDTLFPVVEEKGRAQTIRNDKVGHVRDNMTNSRNTLDGMRGTWWQVVNAVTELVDHQANYKGTQRERAENRMLSTMDGSGADFKAKAFDLALSMALAS